MISGHVAVGYQYHFHLETHACLCVPTEDGYTVYSSTQWTANVQKAVAGVLGISNNRYSPHPPPPQLLSRSPLSLSLLLPPSRPFYLSLSLSLSLSLAYCLSLSLPSTNLVVVTKLTFPCSVDVSVKRCGGGFGGKITRANLTAAACALGAHATKR